MSDEREARQGVFRGHLEMLEKMGVDKVAFDVVLGGLKLGRETTPWTVKAWRGSKLLGNQTAPSGEAALALVVDQVKHQKVTP
jgi:hypothetical protein